MRLLQAWEGFRDRWSARDSSGTGLTDVAPLVLPALVVGFDEPDSVSTLNLGSAFATSAGPSFPVLGIGTGALGSPNAVLPAHAIWVEQLLVHDVSAGAAAVRVQVLEQAEFLNGFGGAANNIEFMRKPNEAHLSLWGSIAGRGAALVGSELPQAISFSFARPGLLLAPGFVLGIGLDVAGSNFRAVFVFRET